MAKSVTSSSSISGGSCACASRCLCCEGGEMVGLVWGHGMALFLSASNIWSYIDIMVIISESKAKHDETIWNMDVWWCMLVQFNPCTVQVHVNLWRLSSTLGCSNVYDVLLSHKISRVLRLHSQSRFAASSFPMLSHDSRQPEAICRENHWSRFKNFTFLKISRNIIFTYWNPAFYVEWMFHSFSFLQIEWCKATRPPEHPTRFAVSESRPAFAWNTGSGTKQKLFRQHPVIAPLKWH